MPVERTAGGTSLIDVLDRVLDKGIVIDAWVRVSLVGIDLITVEARIVVASIDTYLKYSEAVGQVAPVVAPGLEPGRASRRRCWRRTCRCARSWPRTSPRPPARRRPPPPLRTPEGRARIALAGGVLGRQSRVRSRASGAGSWRTRSSAWPSSSSPATTSRECAAARSNGWSSTRASGAAPASPSTSSTHRLALLAALRRSPGAADSA